MNLAPARARGEQFHASGPATASAWPAALTAGRAPGLAPPLRWWPAAGGATAVVDLPALPADTLCVPSLLHRSAAPIAYRMTVRAPGVTVALAPIRTTEPVSDEAAEKATTDTQRHGDVALRGGLDCFETLAPLTGARLEVRLEAGSPSDVHGLLLGHRPVRCAVEDDGAIADTLLVPSYSQLELPDDIARHACSPTSVAMVLARDGTRVDRQAFARACTHPDHDRLLGMWPLNLAVAARHGHGGWIRTFTAPADAAASLRAGIPLVTSIRFEAGELPGAPLPRTSGHLVVLRGLDDEQAHVNDPAAPPGTEARRYPRAAFLRAWLADRGVAYQLWPLERRP